MIERKFYLNPAQREAYLVGARISVNVVGRRGGKTAGIIAPRIYDLIKEMPGSNIALIAPTYQMLLTQTVPNSLRALEDFSGLKEGKHYVFGKKPPSWFKTPLTGRVLDYWRTISFFNGTTFTLVSLDQRHSANSSTFQAAIIDEAKFCNGETFQSQVIPSVGGSDRYFQNNRLFNSIMICSDMPAMREGLWILGYENIATPDIASDILELQALIIDMQMKKESMAPSYYRDRLSRAQREVKKLQKDCIYYREAGSEMNLEIIGEQYIIDQKRLLTPAQFMLSIATMKPSKIVGGFYSSLSENNLYTADSLSFIKQKGVVNDEYIGMKEVSSYDFDVDVDRNAPLAIAFDHNKLITPMVVGQYHGGCIKYVNSLYVKDPLLTSDLVGLFVKYYKNHPCRKVIYYYDSTSIPKAGLVNKTNADVVIEGLEGAGFVVDKKYIGQPKQHHLKHDIINYSLRGTDGYPSVLINKINCEDLVVALERTQSEQGRHGFQKDKSGEKKPENPGDLYEHRTDITDAFDTLLIGVIEQPYTSTYSYNNFLPASY